MNADSAIRVLGGKCSHETFSTSPHSQPMSDTLTPANLLSLYGLKPEKAKRCSALFDFLSGRAPRADLAEVNSTLSWLESNLRGTTPGMKARKAAALMVAIQKSHPDFVPEIRCDRGTEFKTIFTRLATTEHGLKVCALYSPGGEESLVTLLAHSKCSICTLDFSLGVREPIIFHERMSETNTSASFIERVFKKNTSVTTWQGYGARYYWQDLKFIEPHVRELKLCWLPSQDNMQQLQTVLQQGHIDSVSLKATSSEDCLRLAQAVQHSNRNGGRVKEVRLEPARDCNLAQLPEALEILFGCGSIISVTLPDKSWLRHVARLRDVGLAKLKAWLEKGSVEFLEFSNDSDSVDAHQHMMAEITPLLTRNRQLAAAHLMSTGTAFGSFFWHGARVDEFGGKLAEYLTRRDSKAVLIANKYVYIKALQFTRERQAAIKQSELVPHALESDSLGARIDKLMEEAIVCPFPELLSWLAEGLRKNSIELGELDALGTAMRDKFSAAIDAAFDAPRFYQTQRQVTDASQAERMMKALFAPPSFANLQSLQEHLTLALDGVVPKEERENFKSLLLPAFESIVNVN